MKSFLLSFFLATIVLNTASSQVKLKKTIHVTVTNATTGKPVSETEVTYRGLIGKQKQITNTEGKVTFEVTLLTSTMKATIELDDARGSLLSQRATKIFITLTENQDVYEVAAIFQSSEKGITVLVTDADDNNNPLSNAKVTLVGKKDGRDESTYTDGNGRASFEVLLVDDKVFPVLVEKAGYSAFRTSVQMTNSMKQNSVTAALKKDKEKRILKVKVISFPDMLPVAEAGVSADGKGFYSIARGATDAEGIATLIMETGGEFVVTVKHGNFDEEQKTITVNKFDDKLEQVVQFELKRKNSLRRDLKVHVYEKISAAPGYKPISSHQVMVNGHLGMTGTDGIAYFPKMLFLGEIGKVTVYSTDGYGEVIQSIVGGGDNYKYLPPAEDEVLVYVVKKQQKDFDLTVQVLDEITNNPVNGASVQIRLAPDKLTTLNSTRSKGETSFTINSSYMNNAPFRLYVKATGYEERWSDITSDFLQTATPDKYFLIYLKSKEKNGDEKKYGPFNVSPSNWVSTGLTLKKEASFRVVATGQFVSYADTSLKVSPDGGGSWHWWSLVGKTGEQRFALGRSGGGMSKDGGELLLGTPRVMNFYPEDMADLRGTFIVYVYSKDVIAEKKKEDPNSIAYKTERATTELEFLKKLRDGIATNTFSPDKYGRTIEEVIQEIKFIALKYDLQNVKRYYNFEECIQTMKDYYTTNKNSSPKVKSDAQSFLNSMISELDIIIEKQRF